MRREFTLQLSQRLGLGARAAGILGLRLLGENLGVGPRQFKGQSDDLVRRLPIAIEDQQVARLGRRLLLYAECAVPVERLIQELDDLLAAHRRGHGRRGRGRHGRAGGLRRCSDRSVQREEHGQRRPREQLTRYCLGHNSIVPLCRRGKTLP